MSKFIMKFIDEWSFRLYLWIFWMVADFFGWKFTNTEMAVAFLFATLLDFHSIKHQEVIKQLEELKKLLEKKP
jgi:hypothetical protein